MLDHRESDNQSEEKQKIWRILANRQLPHLRDHENEHYMAQIDQLDYFHGVIPDKKKISSILKEATGWEVEAVTGMVKFESFFEMLASKTFPVAQTLRSMSQLDFAEEPDMFHDYIGHVPMLCIKGFTDFTEFIGKLGTSMGSKYHWLVSKIYWFTVEYGLIRDKDGSIKAFGAGLMSSKEELAWPVSGEPNTRDITDIAAMLDTGYQYEVEKKSVYFILEHISQLNEFQSLDVEEIIRSRGSKK